MLRSNSKDIQKGDTFIALKGESVDGHDYINEAIQNGAVRVIVEKGNYNIETVKVKSTIDYLNSYLRAIMPNIKIIGITGTNGKTTTAYLIYEALNMLNIKCAYIGTIGFYLDKKIKDLNNTTPGNIELYEYIKMAYDNNYNYIVMEVSSHALKQKRCDFIDFSYAIFTNLTEDHLDYHKDMSDYMETKKILFEKLCKGINIINNDSAYALNYKINNYVTYGFTKSDYNIVEFKKNVIVNNVKYKTNLIGKHNVYNMSCVIIILLLLNIDSKTIQNVTKKLLPPPGRLECLKYKTNFIYIDYAHTPDAVLKAIETVSKIKHNRLITILGCGGRRDPYKRPIMGMIAINNSSYTIITSDNPRDEDPNTIAKQMVQGLDNSNYEIILNRAKAIKKGIQLLQKNDILLVLGKGHEDYQFVGNRKIHFSDLEQIKKYI
ncbi:MAG: UDP-N-acetylmuramoyl-L-alanyl-D-glutamate--2,6-diaminopimelate ligase [Bacilli bacterium]|nr:UDP-N-acetylmuramoyl-L-alanyl-D-glutamate--2,6-diaminopimelate ligase [Bacilli bacterium]